MAIQPTNSTIPASAEFITKSTTATESHVAARPVAAPSEALAAVQQPGTVPSMSELTQAVRSMNKAIQAHSQNLEFSIDADSERTIVKVVDRQTNEVLRQIPSEEALQIAKALDQASGLLIRQKA